MNFAAAPVTKNGKVAVLSLPAVLPMSPMISNYRNEMIDDPGFWDTEEHYYLGEGELIPDEAPANPDAAAPSSSWLSTASDTLKQLIPAYTQYKIATDQADVARQLNDINLQRAKLNQPPINLQQYQAGMTLPTAGVQVGLSPATSSMLKYGAILVAGFGVLYLLMGNKRRRR